MSIKKQITESQEESELKYLLHANTFSFSKILCAIYCLELTAHEGLNCAKNIFRGCCPV